MAFITSTEKLKIKNSFLKTKLLFSTCFFFLPCALKIYNKMFVDISINSPSQLIRVQTRNEDLATCVHELPLVRTLTSLSGRQPSSYSCLAVGREKLWDCCRLGWGCCLSVCAPDSTPWQRARWGWWRRRRQYPPPAVGARWTRGAWWRHATCWSQGCSTCSARYLLVQLVSATCYVAVHWVAMADIPNSLSGNLLSSPLKQMSSGRREWRPQKRFMTMGEYCRKSFLPANKTVAKGEIVVNYSFSMNLGHIVTNSTPLHTAKGRSLTFLWLGGMKC